MRQTFEVFGSLTSVKLDDSKAFGFVSFANCADAAKALNSLSKEESGSTLYVAKCMNKEERLRSLKRSTLKFMKELARNNLYFRGFPVDGSVEELTTQMKGFFEKFGDVKSLKLMSKAVKVEGDIK